MNILNLKILLIVAFLKGLIFSNSSCVSYAIVGSQDENLK